MKSRRRIAFLKAWDHANCIDDYSKELRLAKWGAGVSLHGSNPVPLMSALCQKRTSVHVRVMSALPPNADMVLQRVPSNSAAMARGQNCLYPG
jgi:hypothetical protein